MVTQLKEKPRCPESRDIFYYSEPICNLSNKFCVLEYGYTCPYYEDFLQKIEDR